MSNKYDVIRYLLDEAEEQEKARKDFEKLVGNKYKVYDDCFNSKPCVSVVKDNMKKN